MEANGGGGGEEGREDKCRQVRGAQMGGEVLQIPIIKEEE